MANALSRRALLVAPLFASACSVSVPVAAAPVGVSDELKWMIDTYEEIASERAIVLAEIAHVSDLPSQPPCPEVSMTEIATRELDYPRDWRERVLHTEDSIVRFFNGARHCAFLPPESPYFARIESDRTKALGLWRHRKEARALWFVESGLEALEEREFALYGKLVEIERWLCAYNCRSVSDVIALATFADKWAPDDELDIQTRSDLLRAISAFALAAA